VALGLASAHGGIALREKRRADTLPITERDCLFGIVVLGTLIACCRSPGCSDIFGNRSGLGAPLPTTHHRVVSYVVWDELSLFLVLRVGYMDGVIGSANSPLSGIGILVVIVSACTTGERGKTVRIAMPARH